MSRNRLGVHHTPSAPLSALWKPNPIEWNCHIGRMPAFPWTACRNANWGLNHGPPVRLVFGLFLLTTGKPQDSARRKRFISPGRLSRARPMAYVNWFEIGDYAHIMTVRQL